LTTLYVVLDVSEPLFMRPTFALKHLKYGDLFGVEGISFDLLKVHPFLATLNRQRQLLVGEKAIKFGGFLIVVAHCFIVLNHGQNSIFLIVLQISEVMRSWRSCLACAKYGFLIAVAHDFSPFIELVASVAKTRSQTAKARRHPAGGNWQHGSPAQPGEWSGRPVDARKRLRDAEFAPELTRPAQ
jgi:hypothetical protein